jgi:hypothetical protein
MEARKLKFDPLEVRPSFRRHYCRELSLPSGKPSGIQIFPISTDEINKLTNTFTDKDYSETIAKDICKTESEFLLWTALRMKYGFQYLEPKQGYRFVHDNRYEEPPEKVENNFEISDIFQQACVELPSKIIDLQLELEEQKKLLDRLTTPETML